MFGSFFRSAVVIGTIYAISPVKLDATPLPTGPQAKSALATAMETAANGAQGQSGQDQIGDLIALGKDLCFANPGLCVEAAKALQDKTPAALAKPASKAQNPLKPADPVKQAEPVKQKQPDALAALIEKTVPRTSQALAKATR